MRVPHPLARGKDCRPVLRDTSLPFMFLQLELLCEVNTKERGPSVLIASAAPQQYVWIETVVLAILRLAIRETGKPAKASPIGLVRTTPVSTVNSTPKRPPIHAALKFRNRTARESRAGTYIAGFRAESFRYRRGEDTAPYLRGVSLRQTTCIFCEREPL